MPLPAAVSGVAAEATGDGQNVPSLPTAQVENAVAGTRSRSDRNRLPEKIGALFALQESVGPDVGRRYQEAETAFFSDAGASAALRALYARLPKEAVTERWQVVETLGRHPDGENMAFLRDIALVSNSAADDQDLAIHRRAALEVLSAYASGEPSAAAALKAVLERAGERTTRAVGLELWRTSRMSAWMREILQARGLPTEYRPLTQAEMDLLRPRAGALANRTHGTGHLVPSAGEAGK